MFLFPMEFARTLYRCNRGVKPTMRDDFDQQAFHDFVLAQGLLPPDILKDAVMNEFVPSQLD